MTNSYGVEVFQSRWGYHAVDHDTYFRLRAWYGYYHDCLRFRAANRRWHAKMEHNRKGPEPMFTEFMSNLLATAVVEVVRAVRTPAATPDGVVPGLRDKARMILELMDAKEKAELG